MGSITLSLSKKISILSLILLALGAHAKSYEGVEIPEQIKCADISLPFGGKALRKVSFVGYKIYVIAYYAQKGIKSDQDENLKQRPLCFDLTYLKNFSNSEVDRAWEYQMKESTTLPYPALKDHVSIIQNAFGAIEGERKQSFVLKENVTELWENGVKKAEIAGPEFQANFLLIWFGKKPPTEDVRKDLLNGEF